jgi:hypothetical protein
MQNAKQVKRAKRTAGGPRPPPVDLKKAANGHKF